MTSRPLILASVSPRRADLLRKLGVSFQVVASDVAEIHEDELTAVEASRINAYRKTRAVAARHQDSLVLGADTLVFLGTTLFGKPASLEDAFQMLSRLQGQVHQVVTGVCLMHQRHHRYRVFSECTAVTFRALTPEQVQLYLSKVNPLDKAGAYAIQEAGDLIIEKIEGSYANVMGLPIERLADELKGWDHSFANER